MVMAQQKDSERHECRQDEWIMNELSKRLGLPGGTDTIEDVMNYQLSLGSGSRT